MKKKKYIPHAWEIVNCPFCNSGKSKLYEKFGPELEYFYVLCEECKLVYHSPRPKYDETFINDAYGQYFSFDINYQYSEEEISNWDKELQEILKFDRNHTSILDVGSCMGDFLKASKKYYKECVGIEVAENMAKFTEKTLNVKVLLGLFMEIEFKNKYSCIHMSHVIEHIPNPVEWIIKSKDILETDGILVISVPNMFSLDRRVKLITKKLGLRKGNWGDNSRTPDHLFEPTIKSLKKLFENNGYKVLEYYTYSRKDMNVSTLFGLIYNRFFKLGSNIRFFVTPK